MRVVKAFAREERQLERFRQLVDARLRPGDVSSTRIQAFYTPLIGFLPNLGLAAILLVGGRQVINGTLTLGDFTAFYAYLLMLIGPMRMLGFMLGMAQRATASGARIFEILDREPGIDAPPAPTAARRAAGGSSCATSRSRSRARRGRRCSDIDLDVEAGSTIALVGAHRLGQDDARLAAAAPLRRRARARSLIDGADVRTVDLGRCGARSPSSTDDPFLFSATVARQHRLRAAGRHRARRSSGAARARAGRRLHRGRCRTATTRGSASAA